MSSSLGSHVMYLFVHDVFTSLTSFGFTPIVDGASPKKSVKLD
jgi:hypothetical protein